MSSSSIFDFTDFRGGFFTDVPVDLMKDNELLQADNCYWRDGLKKRLGQGSFTAYTASNIRGGIRAKMATIWYTILGIELSATGTVELRIGTDNASTTLNRFDGFSATFTAMTLQYGQNIQFAVLDERIVAVNGYNKPTLIWASASNFLVDTMEAYDIRKMDNDDWNAGQYYPALSATSYLTDTADAQSASITDFTLASTSYTTGFWVGCAHTFNKLTLYNAQATNTTVQAIYEYYGRASSAGATGWIGFTPINTPTWTAAGNKEIELNFPIDSNSQEILMDKTASLNSSIGGVYSLKCTVSNTVSSLMCDYIKVEHSQYLSQLLLNDRPDTVKTHKSHMIMGAGNWMRVSPYGTVKGWREADKEYFSEGGLIQALVPHLDYLAIVLDNSIYGLYGNSWSDWSTKLLIGNRGTINKRSACVVNEELYFVNRDGIYGWNGTRLLKLSKHIQTFFDTLNITDAAAENIRGEYWVSFPTSGYTLVFDPDTLRIDDVGDGRMSFYKFTDYSVNQFIPYFGAGDSGKLRAIRNLGVMTTTLEENNFDKFAASIAIPMAFRTRDMSFGNSQQNKIFRRLKMQIQQASAAAGQPYTLIQYAVNQSGNASASTVFNVATGSGVDAIFAGIPPGIDGFTYGIYLNNTTQCDAKFLGFSVEVDKRKY